MYAVETIDTNLTLQDRIRLFLDSAGSREVGITISELADQLQRAEASVYQAVNILRQRNEIDVIKEPLDNGREKIVGIKINKLEPSGRTYRRAAERSGRVERIKPVLDALVPSKEILNLPSTVAYMEKKLAVEDMKARAIQAGIDESVVAFEPDPQAEEAVLLLKAWSDLKQTYEELLEDHKMQGFDLEAERRNNQVLKGKLREETERILLEHNEP